LHRLQRGARAGTLLAARVSGATIDAIAEYFLSCADLGQECDRIASAILIAQPLLYGLGHLRMRQRPLTGR
jgi:hypothetical protein